MAARHLAKGMGCVDSAGHLAEGMGWAVRRAARHLAEGIALGYRSDKASWQAGDTLFPQ